MKDATGTPKSGRRNFMLALGAGGVATAAVVVSKVTGGEAIAAAPTAAPESKGYQLSEHVRTYYRSTRI